MPEENNPVWPVEDEAYERRMQAIAQNGPSGLHYELDRLRSKESYHEEQLEFTREAMREEINRLNLNKGSASE